jgi:hypothetical protein
LNDDFAGDDDAVLDSPDPNPVPAASFAAVAAGAFASAGVSFLPKNESENASAGFGFSVAAASFSSRACRARLTRPFRASSFALFASSLRFFVASRGEASRHRSAAS